MPRSVITRFGSIVMTWSSASWFLTMKRTVSAEMPSRRATSASLEPMSICSTHFSKRKVYAVSLRLNGANRSWR